MWAQNAIDVLRAGKHIHTHVHGTRLLLHMRVHTYTLTAHAYMTHTCEHTLTTHVNTDVCTNLFMYTCSLQCACALAHT